MRICRATISPPRCLGRRRGRPCLWECWDTRLRPPLACSSAACGLETPSTRQKKIRNRNQVLILLNQICSGADPTQSESKIILLWICTSSLNLNKKLYKQTFSKHQTDFLVANAFRPTVAISTILYLPHSMWLRKSSLLIAVFRIRYHWVRIQIFSEFGSRLLRNPDPIRIRLQSKIYYGKLQPWNFFIFSFLEDNFDLPGPNSQIRV